MIIKKLQLEQIDNIKLHEFVKSCQKLIEQEHPEIYITRPVNEWESFIINKIKAASHFGIFDSKNIFIFILTLAEFPQYFTPRMPEWAIEMLTWPERDEDDKIVLLCKEVYKLNQ